MADLRHSFNLRHLLFGVVGASVLSLAWLLPSTHGAAEEEGHPSTPITVEHRQ